MPWVTIVVWLISYLVASSQKGVSKGKAALIATGAAAATYYLAEPTNENNLLGVGLADNKATPGDPTVDDGGETDSGGTVRATVAPSQSGGLISEVGSTLRSWGPVGTAAVVGTTTGALTGNKWLLYGGLAIGAIVLMK